jgi:hypothetical protein
MLTYVRVGLAALVAAAILAVPATPASAACPSRGNDYPVLTGILQLNAAPASGVQLTASGVGFRPGTIVCLEVESTPEQLGTAKVSRDGGFTTTVTMPDLALGQHLMRATGIARTGSTLILNTAFTNGYALPNSGTRVLRWVLLVASVIGLGLLLIRTRRSRTRGSVGAR